MQVARTLLSDPTLPATELAERLGVSPATFYRHFPGGWTSQNSKVSRK